MILILLWLLGVSGVLSAFLIVAATIIGVWLRPGFDHVTYTISELDLDRTVRWCSDQQASSDAPLGADGAPVATADGGLPLPIIGGAALLNGGLSAVTMREFPPVWLTTR